MNDLLERYAAAVARRARLVLAGSLLACAALASGAIGLRIDLDPEKQLPADDPYVAVDRRIREEFGGRNFVAIALLPRSGDVWRPDVLGAVHALTLELLDAPGIIRQNVVSLSSPYVRAVRDRGGVLAAAPVMREAPANDHDVAAVRALYESEPLLRGAVVSDDGRAALVLADFYDDVSDGAIADSVERAVANHRSREIAVAVTGAPILSKMENDLVGQQGFYFLGTIAAIFAVLWLSFGQLQGVVLPASTALLATAAAMGFMGFAGISLNPWTAAVPVVVVTIAAGHSAQMLRRFYEELRRLGDAHAAVIASTAKIGAVMLAAGVTAGSGFAALAILRIPTLTHFGLGVASGIVAAVALEMTFMVALRALWSPGRAGDEGPLSRALGALLERLVRVVMARPRAVPAVFLAVAALALAGLPRLETDVDPQAFFPETTPVGRDLRIFQKHFPATTTLTVLLEGEPGSMKTPEALRRMAGLQRVMAEDPEVGRTSSAADVILRTWQVLAPEDAANETPDDPALVAQLFFLADSPALERFLDRTYSRAVVTGFLAREDTRITRRVLARLEESLRRDPPRDIRVTLAGGVAPTLLALNDHTVEGKALNIAIVLGAIFAVSSLLLDAALGGLYVVAPLLAVLVANLGLFAWLGVAFDLAGASVAAIGVAIGADYAIYFLYRLREEFRRTGRVEASVAEAMRTTGRAVLFVALAIGAGFAVYLASDYGPLRVCGAFVPLTMAVASATALTLLPALALLFRPRFLFARRWLVYRPTARVASAN